MPNKYQHNSERWLRNNAEIYTRMGSPQIAQKMVLCADEVARMKEEVVALKGAAGALIPDVDEYFLCPDIGESRNKLAALVGEEGK